MRAPFEVNGSTERKDGITPGLVWHQRIGLFGESISPLLMRIAKTFRTKDIDASKFIIRFDGKFQKRGLHVVY